MFSCKVNSEGKNISPDLARERGKTIFISIFEDPSYGSLRESKSVKVAGDDFEKELDIF